MRLGQVRRALGHNRRHCVAFISRAAFRKGGPLDRVVGAMGRAFGLRGEVTSEPIEKAESKSFFLRDVFLNVIFPDRDLAVRTQAEVRRLFMRRIAMAAVTAIFARSFLVPSVISFVNNRRLIADTQADSNTARAIDWSAGLADTKLDKLKNLRLRVELLLKNRRQGPPMGYGFPMYQGDKLYRPVRDQTWRLFEKASFGPQRPHWLKD